MDNNSFTIKNGLGVSNIIRFKSFESSGSVWSKFLSSIRHVPSHKTERIFENANDSKTLASKYRHFTPSLLHRQLSDNMKSNSALVPNVGKIYASLLLADISGFTRLSSRLSSEELKMHINAYFTMLIGIIHSNGGDVIKFLGDAVLIAFPYEADSSIQQKSAMILMASVCAIELIKCCGEYKKGTGASSVSLSLHCAISCGIVHSMCLGVGERWEYLLTGPPLTFLSQGISAAKAGEVCISHEAFEYIRDDLEAIHTENGFLLLTGRRIFRSFNDSHSLSQSLLFSSRIPSNENSVQRLGNSETSFIQTQQFKRSLFTMNRNNNNTNTNNSTKVILINNMALYRQDSNSLIQSSHYSDTDEAMDKLSKLDIVMTNDDHIKHNIGETSSNIGHEYETMDSIDNLPNFHHQLLLQSDSASSKRTSNHRSPFNSNQTSLQRFHYNNSTSTIDTERISNDIIIPGNMNTIPKHPSLRAEDPEINGIDNNGHNQRSRSKSSEKPKITGSVTPGYFLSRAVGIISGNQDNKPEYDLVSLLAVHKVAINQIKQYLKGYLLWEDTDDHNSNISSEKIPLSTAMPNIQSDCVLSDPGLCAVLKYFVHGAARAAFEDTGTSYLFELRNVTSIFIEFFGLDDDLNRGILKGPQQVLEICLDCLHKFDGSLRQFTVDDKGCILIAAFGLPGSTHEDNCRRAVEVTALIRQFLVEIGIDCRAGISEGRVFCGLVGCESRCEYTMMGCSVNLAARLMGACEPGEIQVNETVYHFTSELFVYETLPKLHAKGYPKPVAVYRPIKRAYSSLLLRASAEDDVAFVGRSAELSVLSDAILSSSKFTRFNEKAIFITGMPGLGKTRLVAEALRIVEMSSNITINTAVVCLSATNEKTTYFAIRQLLEQIINLKRNGRRASAFHVLKEPFRTTDIKPLSPLDNNSNSLLSYTRLATMSDTGIMSVPDIIAEWIATNFKSPFLNEKSLPIESNRKYSRNYTAPAAVVTAFTEEDKKDDDLPSRPIRMSLSDVPNNAIPFKNDTSFGENVQDVSANTSLYSVDSFHSNEDDEDIFSDDYLLLDLIPLLGEVLSFKSENNVTSSLTSEQIPILREALILRILCCSLESSLLDVIIVDNLHWCDVASLRILSRLARCVPAGALICTSRPKSSLTPVSSRSSQVHLPVEGDVDSHGNIYDYFILENIKQYFLVLELHPFNALELRKLVEDVVGADVFHSITKSDRILDRMMDRCGGSPFHAKLLAKDLKGTILYGKHTEITSLPAEAQSFILSRFDQLSKTNQILLKVASVIGIQFKAMDVIVVVDALHLLTSTQGVSIPELLNDLAKPGSIISVHNNIFTFEGQLTRESIYNLMTVSQREDIHTSLGSYYESKEDGENNNNYLNEIIYHYINSNKTKKKVKYLQVAVEVAKSDYNHRMVLRHLKDLIKISLGFSHEELFYRYCRNINIGKDNVNIYTSTYPVCLLSMVLPRILSLIKYCRTSSSTRYRHQNRRVSVVSSDEVVTQFVKEDYLDTWLSLSDFIPVKISMNTLNIDSKNELEAKLPGSSCTLPTLCLWLWDLGVTEFMLGNMITSSNILLMGMHLAGFQYHSSILKISVVPFLSTLNTEQYIIMQESLEILLFILLLRGFSNSAYFVISLLIRIKESRGKRTGSSNSSDKYQQQQQHEWMDSMNSISNSSNTTRDIRIEALNGLVMTASSDKLKAIKLGNTYIMEAIEKLSHCHEAEVCPDIIMMLCEAIHCMSTAKLSESLKLFKLATDTSTASGNLVFVHLSTLGKAWSSFLSGKVAMAKESVQEVLSFAASHSHKPIYIWALELDILIKGFERDIVGIEFDLELIRTLRGLDDGENGSDACRTNINIHKNALGCTSCAVISFARSLCGKLDPNELKNPSSMYHSLAISSCTSLSSKKQGTVIGGILLFCATYAAMDAYENMTENHHETEDLSERGNRAIVPVSAAECNEKDRSPSVLGRRRSSLHSVAVLFGAPFLHLPSTEKDSQKVLTVIQSGSDALAQHALRFPSLSSLSLAIKIRFLVINQGGCCKKKDLMELEPEIKYTYTYYRKNVFAEGFLHLERTKLCKRLGLSTDFQRIDDSSQITRNCFMKLGLASSDLVSLLGEMRDMIPWNVRRDSAVTFLATISGKFNAT